MENKRVKSLKELATALMVSKVTNDDFYGWQLRKGKTTQDINHSIKKATDFKNGRGKFENEVSMLELYLKDVLKPDKNVVNNKPKFDKLSDSQIEVLEALCLPYKNDVGNRLHHPQDEFKMNTLEALNKKDLVEYYDFRLFLNGAVRITEKGRITLHHNKK